MTFLKYWNQYERRLYGYALWKFRTFHSKSQGDWEDTFTLFEIELLKSWNSFRGASSRDTWVYEIMRRVFFKKIEILKKKGILVVHVNDWPDHGEGDGSESAGGNIELPPKQELVIDPKDAKELVGKIDEYLESCVNKFIQGRRNEMAKPKIVMQVYLLKIVEDWKGDQIFDETGITPSQQTEIKIKLKQCIETAARRDGFGDDIDKFKTL